MSIPTAVFLDTSILDGQQYNFSSTALSSFIPAATKRGLKLILPDPTLREIRRHIDERSQEALKALDDARRKAPFLAKWKHFPAKTASFRQDWEVKRIARQEWDAFIKQFDVTSLDYKDVDISIVMDWYDAARPPFSKSKPKEFPDALAIASLAAYASKNECYIAVVASDPDFRAACNLFGSLLHFESLPKLTELLLLDDSANAGLKAVIEAGSELVEEAVLDFTHNVEIYHADSTYTIDDLTIESVSISDFRIVAIGDHECTITYDAELECSAKLVWDIYYPDEPSTAHASVSDSVAFPGTAKILLSPDHSAVQKVTFVDIEGALELTNVPEPDYDPW